jgi:hypothetical protein
MPHRYTRIYTCEYAPYVTNWNGKLLDKKARDKIKVGDIVRVQISDETRYILIHYIKGEYMTGKIDDPYYGTFRFWCNECNEFCPIEVYSCENELDIWGSNKCNYHCCKKCKSKQKHKHNLKLIKHPFPDGTIITFKKNCILEIPDWTNNTRKIINQYLIPGKGRMFTGVMS